MTKTWLLSDDWSQWDYRFGEISGSIEMKWIGSPGQWELRGMNEIYSMKPIWSNDLREWRITNNDFQLKLKTRFRNSLEEWEIRSADHGNFFMFTEFEGDLRDWTIVDEMDPDVPFQMKLSIIFTVLFHSTPKL